MNMIEIIDITKCEFLKRLYATSSNPPLKDLQAKFTMLYILTEVIIVVIQE